LHKERILGLIALSVPFRQREKTDPIKFWENVLGEDFYIVHFNNRPNVAAKSFNKNPRRVLTNLFRTDHWLSERSKNSNYKIIKSADSDYGLGKLAMSEKELDVFVEAFSNGGFEAPCNWYRNISRNWRLSEGLNQVIETPTLMIFGKYDMVPQVDMSKSVKNLEIRTLECGHWIQQERPEETNNLITEWLRLRLQF